MEKRIKLEKTGEVPEFWRGSQSNGILSVIVKFVDKETKYNLAVYLDLKDPLEYVCGKNYGTVDFLEDTISYGFCVFCKTNYRSFGAYVTYDHFYSCDDCVSLGTESLHNVPLDYFRKKLPTHFFRFVGKRLKHGVNGDSDYKPYTFEFVGRRFDLNRIVALYLGFPGDTEMVRAKFDLVSNLLRVLSNRLCEMEFAPKIFMARAVMRQAIMDFAKEYVQKNGSLYVHKDLVEISSRFDILLQGVTLTSSVVFFYCYHAHLTEEEALYKINNEFAQRCRKLLRESCGVNGMYHKYLNKQSLKP